MFNVHVPTSYANTPTPIFFGFHGYTNSKEHHDRISGMTLVRERPALSQAVWNQLTAQPSSRVQLLSTAPQVSEEEGFIAVIPDGYRASWNAGWCCGAAVSQDLDDVGYAQPSGAFEGGIGAGLKG